MTPPMPVPAQQYVPPVAQPMPVPAPVLVPQPVQQIAPAPAPTAQPTDFHSFMQGVGERTSKQMPDGSMMLHAEYLAQLAQRISQATGRQLTAVTDLAQNPDLIEYTIQVMQMDGRW